ARQESSGPLGRLHVSRRACSDTRSNRTNFARKVTLDCPAVYYVQGKVALGSMGGSNRLAELAKVVGGRRTLVVAHDNPDPDCLGAGLAMRDVLAELTGRPVPVAYGGIIGRAENRALVEVLELDLLPMKQVQLDEFQAFVLVDTQPGAGNYSLPERYLPTVVIDHHQPPVRLGPAEYFDVRTEYGATTTVALEYRNAIDRPIDPKLATAMFYGIKSDTQDLGRHVSEADVEAYLQLFPLVDKVLLPQIERPRLPRLYFESLRMALERAHLWGTVLISALDEMDNPNTAAEMADYFLRLEGVTWSICFGYHGDGLYVSVRTSDPDANAATVIQSAIRELGSSGGHGMMAGAKVARPDDPDERVRLRKTISRRFREVLGVADLKPEKVLEVRPGQQDSAGPEE
ncbi:MAG TPA: DHH family phosphoesterase, partial [Dehalococcoidia bacterium]|nr:DHH family phosphoesterase [Dehalococcoidia bacterium]